MTIMQISILPVNHLSKLILILAEEIIKETKELPTVSQLAMLCKVKHRDCKLRVQELQSNNLVWYVSDRWVVPCHIEEDILVPGIEASQIDIPDEITAINYCKDNDNKVKVPQKVDENDEFDHILQRWNELCDACPRLKKIEFITYARANKLTISSLDKSFDFDAICHKIRISPFLMGLKTKWKVDFDWLISKKDNWKKVLEGKYDDPNWARENVTEYDVPETKSIY